MKILFDHQIFGWQEYGGISRYGYQLALEMATTYQQDVSILAPFYITKYLNVIPAELNLIGIPIKYIPRTGRILRVLNSILAWPITRVLKPDIVHETYYSSKRIAPKSSKVILTVYDMIHEKYKDSFSKNDPTSREKALAVARADHIICISENTKQDLISMFNVSSNKISVVYLGMTLTSLSETIPKIFKPERPFLLYVGQRGGYKNFEGLLRAYAMSSNLKNYFDIVCFGGGTLTQREQELIKELNIAVDRIHQVFGNDMVLAEYYKFASAFVYPSFYEGFGMPPLEAMNLNCPVICSDGGSLPEVVGIAAEMFDPHDIESIQVAIERVINDVELKKRLIARGKEQIKLFSWKRCAQETLDVYRRVLG